MPDQIIHASHARPRKASKQTLALALLGAACSSNARRLKAALDAGAPLEAVLKKGSKAREELSPYLREGRLKTEATPLSICGLLAADPHAHSGVPDMALRCAKILLERGADPDGHGPGTSTPLASLAEHFSRHHPPQCSGRDAACFSMVDALAAAGADMDAEGDSGLSPLASSIVAEHAGLAQALIKRGADILHRDSAGRSIPWLLAFHGEARALPLALEMGADPSAPDHRGLSPLLAALQSRDQDPPRLSCIRALIRHGCHLREAELAAMRASSLARRLESEIALAEARILSRAARPAGPASEGGPRL